MIAFGDVRQLQFDELELHLLGIDEAFLVLLEVILDGGIVHGRLGGVLSQRQHHVLQFPLLLEQGDPLLQFRRRDQGRGHHAIAQLRGRQRLPQAFLEQRRGIALIAQQPLVQFPVEAAALLENRQRQDGIVQLLVADPESLIARTLVQYPFVDQLPQHVLLQARPVQQRRVHVAAQHGLQALALLLIGALEFLKRNLAVADHGGVHRSAALEVIIDAPHRKRDGQQTDDGIGKPALGVITDFL